jgi:hypothetical protein
VTGIPILKLNLAPPMTLWRKHHQTLGWMVLLAGTLGFTLRAYWKAEQAGRDAVSLTREAQDVARRKADVVTGLQAVDVDAELPRWRLAERILGARSIPWSRVTAELERSLVPDVRLRSVQRVRDTGHQVEVKLKGEAKARESEEAFVESLQKNPFFAQVVLEREAERQGGGIEFECTLPVAKVPPPYQPLPIPTALTRPKMGKHP